MINLIVRDYDDVVWMDKPKQRASAFGENIRIELPGIKERNAVLVGFDLSFQRGPPRLKNLNLAQHLASAFDAKCSCHHVIAQIPLKREETGCNA